MKRAEEIDSSASPKTKTVDVGSHWKNTMEFNSGQAKVFSEPKHVIASSAHWWNSAFMSTMDGVLEVANEQMELMLKDDSHFTTGAWIRRANYVSDLMSKVFELNELSSKQEKLFPNDGKSRLRTPTFSNGKIAVMTFPAALGDSMTINMHDALFGKFPDTEVALMSPSDIVETVQNVIDIISWIRKTVDNFDDREILKFLRLADKAASANSDGDDRVENNKAIKTFGSYAKATPSFQYTLAAGHVAMAKASLGLMDKMLKEYKQ